MFSTRFKMVMISFFCLFIVFLYGPMFCILVLSFQGPEGGLTFPMRGLSMFWFESLFDGVGVIDIWSAFGRSLRLGAQPPSLLRHPDLPDPRARIRLRIS